MSDEIPPEWLELREQLARERIERVAARRALLELVPGTLRDLDAAAECECSCHPQPGQNKTHRGQRCQCQISARARRARWRKATKAFAEIAEQYRPIRERHQQELAEAAAELGVEAHEEVVAAPWVVVGTVDGVAWYLRERWDTYEVVVATGDDLGVQPWDAPDHATSLTIRTGTFEDIYQGSPPDYRIAMRFVVGVIREYLARQNCPHPARAGDRYCPQCGTALTNPAAPR